MKIQIFNAIRNAYVNTFVGNMAIRGKDGKRQTFFTPDWFDADCEIRWDDSPENIPGIFIIRPMRCPHKLNLKTRRFEVCEPSEVPPARKMET